MWESGYSMFYADYPSAFVIHHATNTIARWFAMASSKEKQFGIEIEIFFVVAKIQSF